MGPEIFAIGDAVEFKRSFTQQDFDRFAALSHDDNPIHVDPEFARTTPFGGTLCHGMLLYSTLSRGLSEHLPGPGVVPLEQELMFPNGTYAGDELTARIEVTGVDGDGCLELDTLLTKAGDGEPVVTCRGRARVCPTGKRVAQRGVVDAPVMPPESDAEVHSLRLGQSELETRVFTAQDIAGYVDLTGDANPLYLDDGAAWAAGFGARLVPAPLIGSMFSDLLGTRLPGRGTGWMKQKLRYPEPAFLGDRCTAVVQIVRIRALKEIVNLSTVCSTDDGRVVCRGEALVWVHNVNRNN